MRFKGDGMPWWVEIKIETMMDANGNTMNPSQGVTIRCDDGWIADIGRSYEEGVCERAIHIVRLHNAAIMSAAKKR
jgi:hypothetical protein